MRTALFLGACAAVTVCAEEAKSATSMRDKVHAKLVESLPTYLPTKLVEEQKPADESVVVLERVEVKSKRALDLKPIITEQDQLREAKKFDPLKGGTLVEKDIGGKHVELGGWWDPKQGWSFLKISWGGGTKKKR